jgi:hypothetical protein
VKKEKEEGRKGRELAAAALFLFFSFFYVRQKDVMLKR